MKKKTKSLQDLADEFLLKKKIIKIIHKNNIGSKMWAASRNNIKMDGTVWTPCTVYHSALSSLQHSFLPYGERTMPGDSGCWFIEVTTPTQ